MGMKLATVSCRMDKADYHIHPDYSKDATGSIEEYCEKALKLGLKEICFTTHYDRDPFRDEIDPFIRIDGQVVNLSEAATRRYTDHVRVANENYCPRGLSVKVGLEVDYAPHYEEMLRRDLASLDLDYILGSVHCLDHIAITASTEARAYFKRNSAQTMVAKYYDFVKQAAESGLFDAIAHLDIYKKYGLGFYGERILTMHRGVVEPVLERMVKNNVGLEINTGVLRRGHMEFSPGPEIVELALDMGVRIVALGSDAHKVDQLGWKIDESYRVFERIQRKVRTGARASEE
jgi:histidinol-phosphatase (PHP family)